MHTSHYQQFEIPNSWEWSTIGEISDGVLGKMLDKTRNKGLSRHYLRNVNVRWGSFDLSDLYSMPFTDDELERYSINYGDLVICEGGEPGRCAIWEKTESIMFQKALHRIRCHKGIHPHYVMLFINALAETHELDKYFTGSGIKHLTGESLNKIKIPIPPTNEQEKIISIFCLLNNLLSTLKDYRNSLASLIQLSKSKILELAIQGMLVPQDPTDEPAVDMLRRINPKAKIITDNPQCQNLPSGWTLCELRDLCTFLSRGKSPTYSEKPNLYPVFAQKCNLKDGGISLDLARFLDVSTLDKWPVKYHLLDGDILINSTGTGTVGRTRIFENSCLGNYPFVVPDSHVSVVRIFENLSSKYIFYCMNSNECQRYFEENLAGSTNQKELYVDIIGDRKIMLPPLKEQHRIVLKIEELYKALDSIETSLQS